MLGFLARHQPTAAEIPDVAPPAPELNAEVSRLDTAVVDALEADVLKAIQGVTKAIAEAASEVTAVERDLVEIRSHAGELAAAGQSASSETEALASSTHELATTSADIGRAMGHASSRIEEAVAAAQKASDLITQLSAATAEIVGIVDTISKVARQTNLLALNATIEAARAGEAGRGFAVVAGEVKTLSVETANAAEDIRSRIARLRESAEGSTSAVLEVVQVVREVQPVFDTVRKAVSEQDAAISEAARFANATSTSVGRVSERAAGVDSISLDAGARAGRADQATKAADGLARALGQRFVAVIRQSEIGDRRRHDRFPVDRAAALVVGSRSVPCRTVDISEGGALVTDPGIGDSTRRVEIELEGIGRIAAEVVARSSMGLHCAFRDMRPDAREKVAALVADVETGYRPLIRVAQHLAHEVETAIERAIAEGSLSAAGVFDTAYKPIPGTDPVQFSTAYLPVFERLLPDIMEPALAANPKMAFCLASDRNGYIPVHNRIYSQTQRADDPVWNAANSRNRRIFDDRAGITAVRSTRPFVVQAYARDMGGGKTVLMQEVDAPIRIAGRHWGGLRTAYRP